MNTNMIAVGGVPAISRETVAEARVRLESVTERLADIREVCTENVERVRQTAKRAGYDIKDVTDNRRKTERMIDAAIVAAVPGLAEMRELSAAEKTANDQLKRVKALVDREDHKHDPVFAHMVDVRCTATEFAKVSKALTAAGCSFTVCDSRLAKDAPAPETAAPMM